MEQGLSDEDIGEFGLKRVMYNGKMKGLNIGKDLENTDERIDDLEFRIN